MWFWNCLWRDDIKVTLWQKSVEKRRRGHGNATGRSTGAPLFIDDAADISRRNYEAFHIIDVILSCNQPTASEVIGLQTGSETEHKPKGKF